MLSWPIRQIETDVVVLGGGIAGCRACLEAAREGANVVLVTKGILGSGTSVGPVVCAAVGPWSVSEDSRDLHFEGIVVTGRRFLCDQRLARILVDEAAERLIELERFGHLWDRDTAGEIALFPEFAEEIRLPEEDHRYHKNRYISSNRRGMYFGYTGHNVLQTLRSEVRRQGVILLEETTGIRLFTSNDQVAGLLALDYLHGELLVIKGKSTIISTGSVSQLWFPWGLASREMTGDGVAMAYRAGAIISDIELLMTAYLPSVTPAWSGRHKLLQGVIERAPDFRPDYMIRWINAQGEEFLKKYPPERPKTYEELYLKVIRGVHVELEEGRGPLYMDYRSLPKAFLEEVAPFILGMMDKLGRKEGDYLLEVGPNPMWSFGGIKISERCESSLPGLYACGDASNGIKDGFGASVACGVTTCLVLGKRAGEYAAQRARTMDLPEIERDQLEEERERISTLFQRGRGPPPLRTKINIGTVMRRYMHLKNEPGMRKALDEIREIRQRDLPQLRVSSQTRHYNYEVVEALEILNMLDVAEMMIRASLTRKESRRHMFIREDYPERDDHNWLKHIHLKKVNDEMELETVPVEFLYLRPDKTGLRAEAASR